MTKYFISDTHLGDKNAIDYHIRPFNDTDHMNETIVRNWNRVVSYDDTVYILGHLTGPQISLDETSNWIDILNGKKVFVLADEDDISSTMLGSMGEVCNNIEIDHNGVSYYCIHNVRDVPEEWTDWVIHGNSHQLHPQDYPLYNYKKKRVNVSCEMIGYTPISLDAIYQMISNIE